jgi:hypothetical protein
MSPVGGELSVLSCESDRVIAPDFDADIEDASVCVLSYWLVVPLLFRFADFLTFGSNSSVFRPRALSASVFRLNIR